MRTYDALDLLSPPPGAVLGNHGVWLPSLGVKVPFQWGGQVTKRTCREDGYPRETVADEVAVMRALAAERMAPPVGDLVFFREVVSDRLGTWWCDPCGAYGYEVADARALPPGRFSVEAMRRLPVDGSPGAWSDVLKPGNVVNGYLVDVRRSGWDMLRWAGPRLELPDAREPADELRARVHRECQFPAGERALAYQDFWLRGALERGQRRVAERALALGFSPLPGELVLDVGCQSGGFLQHAWQVSGGRATCLGVDLDEGYVRCARALARSSDQNVCVRQMDVGRDRAGLLSWVRSVGHARGAAYPSRVDHLLLLSMEKHLGEAELFRLVDEVGARVTYVETNAVAADSGVGPEPRASMKMLSEVARRGGVHVGNSRDRNLRRLYRIARP